jgi:hypothetical protein
VGAENPIREFRARAQGNTEAPQAVPWHSRAEPVGAGEVIRHTPELERRSLRWCHAAHSPAAARSPFVKDEPAVAGVTPFK